MKRASGYEFHYQNPKLKKDQQNQKKTSLLITIKIILNIQIDLPVCRSEFKITILATFPSQSLNYTEINLYLQEFSNLTIANFTTYTKAEITLQTSLEKFRGSTMCSTFTPNCRYDNSKVELVGSVCCPSEMCSEELCVHKNYFQSLESVIISVFKASTRVRCALISLTNKHSLNFGVIK